LKVIPNGAKSMSRPTILLALLLGLAACETPAPAMPSQAASADDLSYCRDLAEHFDRYYRRGEGQSGVGLVDRQTGEVLCDRGRVADGIVRLKRANAVIGFVEVPRR